MGVLVARHPEIGPGLRRRGLRLGQRRLGLGQAGLGLLLVLDRYLVVGLGPLDGLGRRGVLRQQRLLALVLRLVLLDLGGGLLDRSAGLGDRSLGHLDLRVRGLDLFLHGLHLVRRQVQVGPRLGQRSLESPRIQLEQEVAGTDELIVPNRQVDDRRGDSRVDLYDLRTHLAVTGPGVSDVRAVLEDHGKDGHEHHQAGQSNSGELIHLVTPEPRRSQTGR